MDVKISEQILAEKQDSYIISKYLPTRNLLITKGKVVTLHWKDSVPSTSMVMRHINITCLLDIIG